jgi:AAA domain-containing protein
MAGPRPLFQPPQRLSLDQERLKIIVFGESGVGKTYFGANAPRPLFISTDDGMITAAIAGLEPLYKEPTGYADLEQLYWWAKENSAEFDTIVWDSITTGQRLLIDEIHDDGLATGKEVKPVMRWVPEISEYQAVQRQLARILTDLRRLNKHLILTAGVKIPGKHVGVSKRQPDVSAGVASVLTHWASVIGELVVVDRTAKGEPIDPPRRVLLTAPQSDRETKTRFRSLLPMVADPTFDKIWSAVRGEYAQTEANNKSKETA